MKSYLQGMITGGVLVFAIFVFMGATRNDKSNNSEIIDYKLVQYERLGDRGINKSEFNGWEIYGSPIITARDRVYQAFVKFKN